MPDGGQLITELVIDSSQAVAGAQQFTDAAGGVAQASEGAASAVDDLGTKIDTATQTVSTSATQIRAQNAALIAQSTAAGGSAGALLTLGRTMDQLNSAQAAVTRQVQAGALSYEQAQTELAALSARQADVGTATAKLASGQASLADVVKQFPQVFQSSAQALNNLKDASDELTSSWTLNRAAVQELEAAGVHAFDALSSGLSPLRVALTEGAHVLEAFSLSGVDVGAALLKIGAPIAAVAAGVALLVVHAIDANTQLRTLNTALQGMGTASLGSATGLQSVIKDLETTGTAADAAQQAILNIVHIQGINPSTSSVSTIADLARDISAGTGGDFAATATNLAKALADGTDSATKFAFSLAGPNGLTAAEADTARQMAALGDVNGAANVIVAVLQRQFGGLYQNSLSPTQKAVQDLEASWKSLLDTLSQTGVIQAIVAQLQGVIQGVSDAVTEIKDLVNYAGQVKQQLGQPVTGADLAAAAGAQGGAVITPPANQNQAGMTIPIPPAVSVSTVSPVVDAVLSTFQGGAYSANSGFRSLVLSTIQAESAGNPNAVSPSGAQGLMQLTPGTATSLGVTNPFDATQNVTGGITYLTQLAQQFGGLFNALAAYNWGPGNVQKALAAGTPFPSSVQSYASGVLNSAGLPPNAMASDIGIGANQDQDFSGGSSASLVIPNSQFQATKSQIDEQTAAYVLLNNAQEKFGIDQKAATAYAQAYNSTLADGKGVLAAQAAGMAAASQASTEANIELAKQSTLTDMATKGETNIAQAYLTSEAAGLRAAASVQAQNEALTTGVDYQTRYQQILNQNAATAIDSAAKQYAAGQQTLTANQLLATAAAQSVSAEHDQELQNQATAQTQGALAAAIASGNPTLIARAQALQAGTLAQVQANAAAQESIQLSNDTHGLADQTAQLQLQLSLEGETSEAISKQTDLLKAQQTIANQAPDAAQSTKDAYIAATASVADLTNQLTLANQAQQRLTDGIKGVGDTIDQTLTQGIQNAFSGQTVTNWAQTIKTALAQIASQLLDLALIKPAIGSVLSLLGFTQAGQQFGDFGSLLGSLGNLFGSGSSATTANDNGAFLTPGTDDTLTTGSTITLGDALQGGSLLTKLFGSSGDGSGGLFGGLSDGLSSVTSAINDFGTSLGFASPSVAGLTAADQVGLGIPDATTGIFGGATLSSAAGAPGLGFGAGSLVGSRLGA